MSKGPLGPLVFVLGSYSLSGRLGAMSPGRQAHDEIVPLDDFAFCHPSDFRSYRARR